ncbi:unnamed protein product, partial [Ixodes persulcatus]
PNQNGDCIRSAGRSAGFASLPEEYFASSWTSRLSLISRSLVATATTPPGAQLKKTAPETGTTPFGYTIRGQFCCRHRFSSNCPVTSVFAIVLALVCVWARVCVCVCVLE